MKSKMKKLVSLMLAMAMVLTMTIGMSATKVEAEETEEAKYTITINNSTSGHTYEAYQIFAGDLYTSDGGETYTLSNVKWGSGVKVSTEAEETALLEAIKAIDISESSLGKAFASCSSAADVAKVLSDNSSNSELATTFADVISQYLSTDATASTSTLIAASGTEGDVDYVAAHYEIKGLSAGYYLVKDEDKSLANKDDAYTDYILEVVADTSVTPKSGTPTVVKKVKETNDTTGVTSDWQDAADYDIGDVIPYQLTGTLPQKLSAYTKYQYIFTDTLSAGLTVMKSDGETEATVDGTGSNDIAAADVTVKVYTNEAAFEADTAGTGGTTVVSGYTVSLKSVTGVDEGTTYYGGTVLTIEISDVFALESSNGSITVSSDSIIVVTYSAKLNSSAVVGSNGNPNEVYLTYSNNPNDSTGGETGKTPEDKVTVFTFKLVVNKTDGKDALDGAGFTLYKYNGTGYVESDKKAEVSGTSNSIFTFTGLDSGKYKIVESTVPNGYNKANDVYFEIVATYPETADTPTLSTLVIKDSEGTQISVADGVTPENDETFTTVVSTCVITTTVVNQSGSVLPSTGGIGTTIFYIVGAILVIGAGVILVTRRRTRA